MASKFYAVVIGAGPGTGIYRLPQIMKYLANQIQDEHQPLDSPRNIP